MWEGLVTAPMARFKEMEQRGVIFISEVLVNEVPNIFNIPAVLCHIPDRALDWLREEEQGEIAWVLEPIDKPEPPMDCPWTDLGGEG